MPAASARRDGSLVRKAQEMRPSAVVQHVVDEHRQGGEREQHDEHAEARQQPVAGVACADHAYSSRKRLRSQVEMRLSANVLTKSSMPTAKIVRYSSVPAGVSPRLTCTM